MDPLKQVQDRLAELRSESKALLEQRGVLIDTAAAEKRGFTDVEQASYDDLGSKRSALEAQIPPLVEREKELEELARSEKLHAEVRASGAAGEKVTGSARVTDAEMYQRGDRSQSFVRDMYRHAKGDSSATERLFRHNAMATEKRALGNTNAAGGSGGELAPPAWWVSDFIRLVRPGRVTADLLTKSDVPAGVSSVSIPKMLTGTTTAIQSTQNTALSQTDLTTGSVTTGFTTIGGKQVVSQQLIDQAAIDIDQVVMTDLAAAYAQTMGSQIYNGTGAGSGTNSVMNGILNATILGSNQSTFTSGSPTAALFYSKAAGMLSAFTTNRYADPTHWIMHPRRWYWLLAQVDSQGRPLVVPSDVAVNPIADSNGAPLPGVAGRLLSLPVVIDPQIPTNLGAGTNQDEVFLVKADDLWLFESAPQAESFRQPYADSLGVLFRLFTYAGTILNRYSSSIATMNGTGLIAPTF